MKFLKIIIVFVFYSRIKLFSEMIFFLNLFFKLNFFMRYFKMYRNVMVRVCIEFYELNFCVLFMFRGENLIF